MVTTKQLNIKNRTYYFWNDLINLKNFNPKCIYYIGYVTKKPEYNIDSVNPLYLLINKLDGFNEEKEGSKYLNISLTCNNMFRQLDKCRLFLIVSRDLRELVF